MKEMSASERKKAFVPRVCIFGGKAFATYVQAKRIVKFITDVGSTINHDPEIGDLLKVRDLFIIYNVLIIFSILELTTCKILYQVCFKRLLEIDTYRLYYTYQKC